MMTQQLVPLLTRDSLCTSSFWGFTVFKLPGQFAPRRESAKRTLANSLPGTFTPRPFCPRALSLPGPFAPLLSRSLELSLPGAK